MHRVDHADDEARRRRIGHAAQQHVTGDGLVERGRLEAVGARQIENAQHLSIGGGALAFRRSTVTPG